MERIRISLFGRFSVLQDDAQLIKLDSGKVQELLSYLLLYSTQAHSREKLADLLWGDMPSGRAKKYLRQTIWQIQTALTGSAPGSLLGIIEADAEYVRINHNVHIWLDVYEFQNAYTQLRSISGYDFTAQQAQTAKNAVNLYLGDLLDGWYQDWCILERERFQSIYLVLLDKLLEYCEKHNLYEEGLTYGIEALRHERARERTHCTLMRLHFRAGHRPAALRQFQACKAALQEELGVEPSRNTLDLLDAVRLDHVLAPLTGSAEDEFGWHGARFGMRVEHLSPTTLNHLRTLYQSLSDVLDQLKLCIQKAQDEVSESTESGAKSERLR